MIASMTAYGRHATQNEWGQAIWEIRSINHRYLDLTFKMSDNFREWETYWRNLATQFVYRGKVECHLTFIPSSQTAPLLKVNKELVDQLLNNCKTIAEYPGVNPTIKAIELLRWPEVLVTSPRDISQLKEPLTQALESALEDLVQMRQREGKQLREMLQTRLAQVLVQVDLVREKLPQILQAQKQKLEQKLSEIQVTIDRERLEQELVFFAQRIDVEEEMDRLAAHTIEVSRALEAQGAMGRRLDFLMQEMNREANTLGAKACDSSVTGAAVELKVLIEQMREQIQNVE